MSKAIIEGPDIGACGRFNIVVKNADGSIKKDYGWQSNLITQAGLDSINRYQKFIFYDGEYAIILGTGSGTPSIADTGLFEMITDLGVRSDGEGIIQLEAAPDLKLKADYIYPDGYAYGTYQWSRTFNSIKNKNITEIGLCSCDSHWRKKSNIYTHAIIRDENGQPTAITVLDGELLSVRYEVYCFFPFTTKRGTIKLKKTPDMAIPEQYTEEEYDYQLQTFRAVTKQFTDSYDTESMSTLAPFFIKIPDDATPGPVDFDKWKVQYKTNNLNGTPFNSDIRDLFNPTHANNALFFVNMDQEYRTKNLSSVERLWQSKYNSLLSDTPSSNDNKYCLSHNKYKIDGYPFSSTIIITPFHKDGRIKTEELYCYNSGNSGDNGLRGFFVSNAKLGEYRYGDFWVVNEYYPDKSRTTPNMLVVFSKKGTGEGIKKEWGWFLEFTFAAKTVGIDFDSVKIVNASMDTSAKVLNQTHTLDLTYEEGATYNVEIQSLVENVPAEDLVSVDGLTLTQVAQSGSFKVIVTVSKEGMVPRTFTQSFTIASSN